MHAPSSPEPLFVYGTLRRATGHEMQQRLAAHSEFAGDAWFRGRLFMVDDYPGAVPSARQADRVRGEVYRLRDPGLILAILDEYEGCDPDSPATALYRRELADVTLDGGGQVTAWIYLYNRPTTGLQEIESGDFLNVSGARLA